MTTVIDFYPKCVKPRWLKKGATVWCLGEAQICFKVETVGKYAAFLVLADGTHKGAAHGWESFTKLSKPNPKQGVLK